MKLSKLIVMSLLTIVAVCALSYFNSASAMTNEELMNYLNQTHNINGSSYTLSEAQKAEARTYLAENPVTNAQADVIVSDLESAKAKIAETGVTSLSELSDTTKSEVISLVQAAGEVAGVSVVINTDAQAITVVDKDTGTVVSSAKYSTESTTGGLSFTDTTPSTKTTGKILEGSFQTYDIASKKAVIIRASGDISKFRYVKVDGKVIDGINYSAKSGSTVLELKPEYLKTLPQGEHQITLVYTDEEVSTNIHIVDTSVSGGSATASTSTSSSSSARTFVYTGADNTVALVFIAVLAVVAVSTVYVKKAYAN